MAVPKKKTSKARSKSRRTHYRVIRPALGTCPKCKALVASHRACPLCGFYKGKEVIALG